MNRTPSFIASVCFVVAILTMGPFGEASGNEPDPAANCVETVDATPSTDASAPCQP